MANDLRYFHVVVPQGTEGNTKLESKFQELLINMRNTFTGKRVSLEFFGLGQYTYFFIVVEEKLLETVEGLVYASFPDAEVKETQDYTLQYDPAHLGLAGAAVTLHHSDIYPIKTYDLFEEDSATRIFSVISKIPSGDQVWVQMIAEPQDDTALYHLLRKIRIHIADFMHFFSIRDRMRSGGRAGIQPVRHKRAHEKMEIKPYTVLSLIHI